MGVVGSGRGHAQQSIPAVVVKLLLFGTVCSLLTAYLAFTIGNIHVFQHSYGLTATFDDATGVLKADNVKVAGVVVGTVNSVKIDNGRARLTFSVRDSVKVPSDSSVAIRWRNLIGERYVYIYPGTASTVLRDGDRMTKTRSVVDVGELFNRLGPIVKAVNPKDVNTFLDTIVQALDGNTDKIRQSIDNLAVVAQSLGSRDQQIGRLIGNVNTVASAINDRDAQIRTVLDNLVLISRTFSENTDVLNTAVTELGDFSDNFGALLANNSAQIDRIVANLNAIVDEVRTKLPALDSVLGGLDAAAKSLVNSSRYGDWLDNNIYCGALLNPAQVKSNDPCISGIGSIQNSSPAPSQSTQSQSTGAAAITQLLTDSLSP
jgi:phospholipid/cholesterol/gamma-HCH transport system substrate-binding protein